MYRVCGPVILLVFRELENFAEKNRGKGIDIYIQSEYFFSLHVNISSIPAKFKAL